jgi:hypothetical protein
MVLLEEKRQRKVRFLTPNDQGPVLLRNEPPFHRMSRGEEPKAW